MPMSGEDDRAPVFSPEIPAQDAAVMSRFPETLTARCEPAPSRPGRGRQALAAGASVTGALDLLIFVAPKLPDPPPIAGAGVGYLVSMAQVMGGLALVAFGTNALFNGHYRQLRRARRTGWHYHGRYLLPARDLDEAGRGLLARARRAAHAINALAVYRDEVIDTAANDAALPSLVWDLAVDLADLAAERDRVQAVLAQSDGPVTRAALAAQTRAIAAADHDLRTRAAAIEDYTRQVAALDTAYQDILTASGVTGGAPDLDGARLLRSGFAHAEVADLRADARRCGQLLAEQAGTRAGLPPLDTHQAQPGGRDSTGR
jgi:signal transduction histidine kinase